MTAQASDNPHTTTTPLPSRVGGAPVERGVGAEVAAQHCGRHEPRLAGPAGRRGGSPEAGGLMRLRRVARGGLPRAGRHGRGGPCRVPRRARCIPCLRGEGAAVAPRRVDAWRQAAL